MYQDIAKEEKNTLKSLLGWYGKRALQKMMALKHGKWIVAGGVC